MIDRLPLLVKGVCPICKAGELVYEGLNKPSALTTWEEQEPIWACSNCD